MLDGAIVRQPDATPCCVLYVAHAVPEVVSRASEYLLAPVRDWGHASELDDVRGEVAIVGIGETAYTKASGRTAREIGAEAAERAIADAGLGTRPTSTGSRGRARSPTSTSAAFHEHFGTTHDLWTSPWGGGMAWAATAPYLAARAIRDGRGPPRAERVPGRVGDATGRR